METESGVETEHVEIRREEIYACGCTTTRIENYLLASVRSHKCNGHGKPLVKVIATTEYKQLDPNTGER